MVVFTLYAEEQFFDLYPLTKASPAHQGGAEIGTRYSTPVDINCIIHRFGILETDLRRLSEEENSLHPSNPKTNCRPGSAVCDENMALNEELVYTNRGVILILLSMSFSLWAG